ncbi:DUF4179 domain-containing protein [Bacillus sp. FJAT-49705]|uniref:DUF4179 domain-containing protein n=1 Tax=Cytobacillus citreus TaxID=2833586 RepID=A0ABS5NQ76_9BACI|nr:DUF4179 domain-containing protein [Cytobacillus citreus]MBS4189971.1 DUF4179 domain-containing protein [Cytobacillus citreus]
MNKDKVHHYMNDIEVPVQQLVAREKAAIFQAKKKQKAGKAARYSLLVACGLCVSILGFGFVSTGMATALAKVPIIGPIYEQFRDISSDKLQSDKLATVIEKQDSQNGLTMTVKEAVYDGGRLIVTVAYTGERALSLEETKIGYNEVLINGKQSEVAIGSTIQGPIDENTLIEYHQFTLSKFNEFGDNIDVTVQGKDLFGYSGEWKVDFPLEKVQGEIQEFHPYVKASTSDHIYSQAVEKITFSPLSTRIDLTSDYPEEMDENDTWPWFEYMIKDDKGKVYEGLDQQIGMAGKNGRKVVLALPPMERIPKSFTILPIVTDEKGNKEEMKELELVVQLDMKE